MNHALIYGSNVNGPIMLEYFESISMMLLCVQAAYLTFHCHKWKGERTEFSQWTQNVAHSLGEDLQEFGALLSDIADILDSSPQASNPTPSDSLSNSITGALIQSLMGGLNNRVDENAEKESQWSVQDGREEISSDAENKSNPNSS